MNFMSKTFKSTTFNRLLVDSMNHTNFIHLYAVVHLSESSRLELPDNLHW